MAGKGSKFTEIKGVSKADITELKAFASPPALVKEVLTATALLLGMPEEQAKVCAELMSNLDWNCNLNFGSV